MWWASRLGRLPRRTTSTQLPAERPVLGDLSGDRAGTPKHNATNKGAWTVAADISWHPGLSTVVVVHYLKRVVHYAGSHHHFSLSSEEGSHQGGTPGRSKDRGK
jgi:hypothetical protein